ncbi:DNA gyrase subunit beta [Nitzschia inconspicua]|uniref:DNA topoisomerase 2 n=1 Tax=Nitzschia inconspicua TaxID=303405 RepID=A0A9K3KF47_9STRA|nr:DNA gyrase subunit beta [Nitzschia inconspicua]
MILAPNLTITQPTLLYTKVIRFRCRPLSLRFQRSVGNVFSTIVDVPPSSQTRYCGYRYIVTNRHLGRSSLPCYDYSRQFDLHKRRFFASSSVLLEHDGDSLEDSSDENVDVATTSTLLTKQEKSIEEQYSRKTPLEHVLLRPGMYVGPTERLPPNHCWVLDPTPSIPNRAIPSGVTTENIDAASPSSTLFRMVHKEYGLIPALIKIFDEILVNATDNRLRHPTSCNKLDVTIDPGHVGDDNDPTPRDPMIRIWNNGKGIPIQMHKQEQLYLPEMLFGHLLSGSNFDDSEKRLTGGRHGYGAKLTNIFSKRFQVETVDARRQLRYKQTWTNNMKEAGEPIIESISDPVTGGDNELEDYTCITFVPDIQRLSGGDAIMTVLDHPNYAMMCRRVVDAAGCAAGKLRVTLNGQDVSMASFADYTNMYRKEDAPQMCYTNIGSRWQVGIGLSDEHSFESVSFVNGMATSRGGTHVNAIINQVTKKIIDKASKIDPSISQILSPGLVRRNLFVACNALIENPTFDSQMKEYLTSNPTSFGSSFSLKEIFLNQLVQAEEDGGPGIVEEVIRVAKGRQQANLFKQVGGKKNRRQLLSIPKLEDAHRAGSDSSSNCTLILTEGDSAKALAVAGLEVIGRDKYGVFPLRGKFLNVRHASVDQLGKNQEVKALVSILGLDFDKEYDTREERNELRYGHVMLMTDQDTDGSHIKGLVINFFRHFWPKLLKPSLDEPLEKPFLSSFVTPLLKATKKGTKKPVSFFSMAEYNAWRQSLLEVGDDIKSWKVKYYKGLGTSTPAEAKEYFSDFKNHHRPFLWSSEIDGELLDKVFDKSRAADRRDWINKEYDPETTLYSDPNGVKDVTYEDFINKELIHFSNADNIRSLPSLIDGLKPSQRKVLHACFKRKLKSEIKVAQLSGYCAEHTAYHHGEASLQGTIIGMAQDFVGSNNVNLLVPSGQFGTRLAGGEDAASPRYIFTHLSPVARYLFPEDDDLLLEYLEDDGQQIEPSFFCPIIPLLLVNGSQGIGTGWSTFIPQHSPISVVDYMRAKLEQTLELPRIEPFSRGFTGIIERNESGYTSYGKIKILDNKSVLVDELPIGVWTNKYKAHLLKMQSKGIVVDFREDHTTTKVSFKIKLKPGQLLRMQQVGLEKSFRLKSNLHTTNMNAFDANGQIQKYDSAESIADAYFPTRLSLYHDRKSVVMSQMRYTAEMLQNKARFIQMVADSQIDLMGGRTSEEETNKMLRQFGFKTKAELEALKNDNAVFSRGKFDHEINDQDEVSQITEEDVEDEKSSFDYLLKMPLSSLTTERIEALRKEASKTQHELKTVKSTEPEEIWLSDLDKLARHL